MDSHHCCRCPIIEFSRSWEALAVSVDLMPTCNIIEIHVHRQYQLCIQVLDSFHVAFLVTPARFKSFLSWETVCILYEVALDKSNIDRCVPCQVWRRWLRLRCSLRVPLLLQCQASHCVWHVQQHPAPASHYPQMWSMNPTHSSVGPSPCPPHLSPFLQCLVEVPPHPPANTMRR